MLDRRELLKFFGIGATITPVLNGNPVIEHSAKLLAEPQIQPLVLADKFPDGHAGEHFRDRLRWNPYEAIWLKYWQIENNPGSWINHGIGPLEHILKREPTDAEKTAVAGVIQWFGSNCGHGFIDETLRACGFRVIHDDTLPSAKEIQQIQHLSVWRPGMESETIVLNRHGRSIRLKAGEYPQC